jgi:hypothetical protein
MEAIAAGMDVCVIGYSSLEGKALDFFYVPA